MVQQNRDTLLPSVKSDQIYHKDWEISIEESTDSAQHQSFVLSAYSTIIQNTSFISITKPPASIYWEYEKGGRDSRFISDIFSLRVFIFWKLSLTTVDDNAFSWRRSNGAQICCLNSLQSWTVKSKQLDKHQSNIEEWRGLRKWKCSLSWIKSFSPVSWSVQSEVKLFNRKLVWRTEGWKYF